VSRSFVLVAVAAVAVGVRAQTPVAAPVVGSIETIDGRVWVGSLTVADGRCAVHGETAGPRDEATATFALGELRRFERRGAPVERVAVPHRVWLRSGLELPAVSLAVQPAADGRPAAFAVTLPCGAALTLPLPFVRALRHGGADRPLPPLFEQDLETPPANDDALHVVQGDQQQRSLVLVTGFTGERVDFVLRGDAYDFPFAGVAGVVFADNTGVRPDPVPLPRAVVELTTGERLVGGLALTRERLQVTLAEGAVVDVDAQRLRRIDVLSDRLVWLDEQQPTVEQTPAFDRVWPWTARRTIAGPGFVVAGRRFERGIAAVPRTRLTFEVPAGFDVFECVLGIDDRGGQQAHAVFRILVDGEVVNEPPAKLHGDAPEAVRVPVAGKRTLTLEIDFGKNYDLGDHCVFADARFVRTTAGR
jgi:hypothetical protein